MIISAFFAVWHSHLFSFPNFNLTDRQAMDRAHRIGQKRVVNVYRLITKDTLEEKIMGLQRFKQRIADSIVNEDNVSMQTMDTNQLVDLFNLGEGDEKKKDSKKPTSKMQALMQELGELWDAETQYEEYDLDLFLQSIK